MHVELEGPYVEGCEIEVDAEIEEFKGHHEPCMEVAVKIEVGVELFYELTTLRKLVLADSPVRSALNVPCKPGLPVSDECGPRDGFLAWVDVAV